MFLREYSAGHQRSIYTEPEKQEILRIYMIRSIAIMLQKKEKLRKEFQR